MNIGQKVQLFPDDSNSKIAILVDWNRDGMTFEITELYDGKIQYNGKKVNKSSSLSVGDKIWYSPTTPITCKLL